MKFQTTRPALPLTPRKIICRWVLASKMLGIDHARPNHCLFCVRTVSATFNHILCLISVCSNLTNHSFQTLLKYFSQVKNAYFDQHLKCTAPKCWSKYTTNKCSLFLFLCANILCNSNLFSSNINIKSSWTKTNTEEINCLTLLCLSVFLFGYKIG